MVTDITSIFGKDPYATEMDYLPEIPESKREPFARALRSILRMLKTEPYNITAEDVRQLHDNKFKGFEKDEQAVRILAALDTVAENNRKLYDKDSHPDPDPDVSILTSVRDLHDAVDSKPQDVTSEVLQTTQSLASKMQKVAKANPSNPELEADHLHSLEAGAHGYSERAVSQLLRSL